MAVEAWLPSKVEFGGQPIPSATLITLYDSDGPAPAGCITGADTPAKGESARLAFCGRHEGQAWSVICSRGGDHEQVGHGL
ncbi:MAG TPA: hypothetical protein VM243_18155 [Phycisphaerae bacterium]|nr:hypothetical protein [Phycisphaerae bacterium]